MLRSYLLILVVTALTTYGATWVVRAIARPIGAVEMPDDRRVHQQPTPTCGGIAMFVAFLLSIALASQLPPLRDIFTGSSEPIGVVMGAAIIFATGLIDDLRGMSAPAKVAGQVLGASIMALQGVQMFFFRVPFIGVLVLSPDLGFFVTVVWVVLVCNAVNLVDGLDGLAAGIVAIAALAFFVYGNRQFVAGLLTPGNIGPLLAVLAAGVCIGFLPHNFHPARIFMGDAGALFLGVLLASSTLEVGGRTTEQFTGQAFFFYAPIFIPFVILGVPMLDTAFSVVRRVARRSGWAVADKEHLHHRLVRLGHGHRRSVLILWAWTLVLAALVLAPTVYLNVNAMVVPGIAALGVLLYTLFHPQLRRAAAQAEEEAALIVASRAAQSVEVVAALTEPDTAEFRLPAADVDDARARARLR